MLFPAREENPSGAVRVHHVVRARDAYFHRLAAHRPDLLEPRRTIERTRLRFPHPEDREAYADSKIEDRADAIGAVPILEMPAEPRAAIGPA